MAGMQPVKGSPDANVVKHLQRLLLMLLLLLLLLASIVLSIFSVAANPFTFQHIFAPTVHPRGEDVPVKRQRTHGFALVPCHSQFDAT